MASMSIRSWAHSSFNLALKEIQSHAIPNKFARIFQESEDFLLEIIQYSNFEKLLCFCPQSYAYDVCLQTVVQTCRELEICKEIEWLLLQRAPLFVGFNSVQNHPNASFLNTSSSCQKYRLCYSQQGKIFFIITLVIMKIIHRYRQHLFFMQLILHVKKVEHMNPYS